MSTYVILSNFTQKGVEDIQGSPERLGVIKSAVEAAGGTITGFYLTMGRYDTVLIAEAPDDQTTAALLLAVGAQGYTRTETLKAFTETEYQEIIGRAMDSSVTLA